MADLNDSLRAFAKRPLGYKVAVFIGGMAVVGGLYYQLRYSGLSDELDEATQLNQVTQQRNAELKQREVQYRELVKQNDALKETLQQNRLSLPTTAELPSFFVHLQKQAAASGANILQWSRKNEVPFGNSFVKVPVSMSISGTFYQINRYFHLLSQTDRIITVESLSLGGAAQRGDETILRATFQASTFRLAGQGVDDLYKSAEPEVDGKKPEKSKAEQIREARRKRERDVGKAEAADKAGGAP